jgi:hypothetical protein
VAVVACITGRHPDRSCCRWSTCCWASQLAATSVLGARLTRRSWPTGS